MGWADMLIKLGIPYASNRALKLATHMMKFITTHAKKHSNNSTHTTIAPTGSISTIAGVEGYGIEPLFALSYTKNVAGGLKVVSPLFADAIQDDAILELVKEKGTADVPGVPDHIKKLFATAMEIPPEWHVKMQAAFQIHTDNAVSKTINLSADATKEDVHNAYMLAYELWCKGITVYRDGCRENVYSVGNKPVVKTKPQPVMEIANGTRYKLSTGCGTAYMMVFWDDDENIVETFTYTSKGGCPIFTEATSRLISLALRYGIPIELVIDQLDSCGTCSAYQHAKGRGKEVSPGSSCPSAIANVLKKIQGKPIQKKRLCPDCGQALMPESGCWVCSCGYSKCG